MALRPSRPISAQPPRTRSPHATGRTAQRATAPFERRAPGIHGLTGTNRARPGLREALAACWSGDTLVVTKVDRLARSLTDARDIVEELTAAPASSSTSATR